ncbi:hypothetical protein KVT40_007812 [Elsinoe batatas]|uniref:C3H1-type domain-containing protein n=1 Tax=Elsinoe batatas TaxID=2601811 RepID=A0A8K0KZI3_9PEZI|nr:hypothetical protein KVT40_007812 [Elsinoe batatas]
MDSLFDNIANDEGVKTHEGPQKSCQDWPLGECHRGDECGFAHHPNLDPALYKESSDSFKMPTERRQACLRCLQGFKKCDKKDRGGLNDPCSECRHFGGDRVKCVLSDSSYNDEAWRAMLNRESHGFTIKRPPGRLEPPAQRPNKPKPAPKPMPLANLKAGWTGSTQQELLNEPLIVPDSFFDCPRAHLVPPGMSAREMKLNRYLAIDKRKREDERETTTPPAADDAVQSSSYSNTPPGHTQQPAVGPSLPGASIPGHMVQVQVPAPDPVRGPVIGTWINHQSGVQTHYFGDGSFFGTPPVPTNMAGAVPGLLSWPAGGYHQAFPTTFVPPAPAHPAFLGASPHVPARTEVSQGQRPQIPPAKRSRQQHWNLPLRASYAPRAATSGETQQHARAPVATEPVDNPQPEGRFDMELDTSDGWEQGPSPDVTDMTGNLQLDCHEEVDDGESPPPWAMDDAEPLASRD